jgi:hypothetical protein
MRHLQLSKSLYRTVSALPAVKSAEVSLGAAGHTLTVRALQLTALANAAVGIAYAPLSERDAVYPTKRFSGKSQLGAFTALTREIVGSLADNHSVQLAQSAKTGEYRQRYTRCTLTNKMRLLNEALPEFDFDPFTANLSVQCRRGSPARQEALLRLHGLPIRVAGRSVRLIRHIVVVAQLVERSVPNWEAVGSTPSDHNKS